jgi:glycosyltransferase involved in cell wall biosynthesis
MNQSPFISVVVPAYNAEKVLSEALESVRRQSFQHHEVIVVDDGSTDRTGEIARRFCDEDSRFKLIRQANAGSAVARNTAIKQAAGEWIAFLDADDFWLPTKLESQINLWKSDPGANLIFTNYWIWSGQEDRFLRYRNARKFPEGHFQFLHLENVFGTSTVMIPRELFEKAGPFDPELRGAQDWDLWLRISENGLRARGVWEPQARYRIWPGGVTADRVRNATYGVRVMEKAVARSGSSPRLKGYRRALRMARARLELSRVHSLMKQSPAEVPRTVLRAWRCYPSDVKWLAGYLGLIWPAALGGNWTSRAVRKQLQITRGWRQPITEKELKMAASGVSEESDVNCRPVASVPATHLNDQCG